MGQKVNPHGLRVGVIKDWDSRWFVNDSDFGDVLVSDYNLRKYIKSVLPIETGEIKTNKKGAAANADMKNPGISKIEIERDGTRVRINIHCARPGVVIGAKGASIEILRKKLEEKLGKPVFVNAVAVAVPEADGQLVAESIASQLEKRGSFRRAMKQAIRKAMMKGVKGIKVRVSGRLNGAEIARSEHYHEGTIPLQTLRADIDYGFSEANTTYGKIGVKVWIYKGEVLPESKRSNASEGSK